MANDNEHHETVLGAYQAVYDNVLARVPRDKYLTSGDVSLKDDSFLRQHRKFLIQRFGVLLALVVVSTISLVALILIGIFNHQFSVPFFALFFLSVMFAITDLSTVAKYKKYRLDKYEFLQNKATDYEPSGIWTFDKFPEPGRRLKLIHALLGARRMERMLAESTTTAIDVESSDALVSHLIVSLAKCKEDDIDPYLELKAEQFCEAVFETTKRLLPIMELHTMLLKESMKEKEADAKDEDAG